ncbi:tRNA uridine-5-carboxymethylaminomethyl(34) synthesis GTPase MnmE [Atrimonas thermophila]|uniref:tRNA uridine-5-carboxymethylaminomethyl(34) synthesis GTPase MnmE n=1 Tax=Atrimonas thermophila TaxID=3064161 RepID=UPI00399D0DEF
MNRQSSFCVSEDTIAAIATPSGMGAIGIVRMSGPRAIPIAASIFKTYCGKRLEDLQAFHFYLGRIVDPSSEEVLDEAFIVIMRAPRSYTREDVVEFQVHGGPLILHKVLELCLRYGARLARPGEFTLRAFLNGRIDLTQAEAVAQMVQARSEKALSAFYRGLSGQLSQKVKSWQDRLLLCQAYVQAFCDFADAVEGSIEELIWKELETLEKELAKEVQKSERFAIFQNGILVVIAGKPNVGKSSLFNLICGEERAIVTPIPGTTRDVLEVSLTIDGVPFRFVDTAGFRSSQDVIERIGLQKAEEFLEKADLVVLVFDMGQPLEEEDFSLVKKLAHKRRILVLNKSDLSPQINKEDLNKLCPEEEVLEISVLQRKGIEKLFERLVNVAQLNVDLEETPLLVTQRQREILEEVLRIVQEARGALKQGLSIDVVGILLEEGLQTLRRFTGEDVDQKLLDAIFSNFCIGK